MKYIICTSVLLLFSSPSFANVPTKAKEYFSLSGNEKKAVKSTSSGLCHDARSPSSSLINVHTSGDKANVYDNINECLSSGGGKPKYLIEDQNPTQVQESELAATNGKNEVESKKKFAGLSFSPALMMISYEDPIAKEVSIEDGKITAHEIDVDAVLGVESHYFWTPGPKEEFGIGPYVSLGLVGEEGIDPLSTFGFGVMLGWRNGQNKINSWNVGFGYYWNSDANVLKDGLSNGSETTITDTSKLTTKEQVGGWALIFSAAF